MAFGRRLAEPAGTSKHPPARDDLEDDRALTAARRRLPPVRLRLPRVRPGLAQAPRLAARLRGRAPDDLGAAGQAPARPGLHGAPPARPLDQRHRDVPRPGVLRRVPREGRAAAPHLSVHPDLGRRLLDRRGGLLAGDPAAGGGGLRPDAHLRDRHQRIGARAARERACSRSTRCASTRRTTSRPAGRALSPSTTSPSTTARNSSAR